MPKYGVFHFEAYVDFISIVMIDAPDNFPKEDFRRDDEQLDLEKAFGVLRSNFPFVEQRLRDPGAAIELKQLLDRSLAAYRSGQQFEGAHLLQEFQEFILTSATHRGP